MAKLKSACVEKIEENNERIAEIVNSLNMLGIPMVNEELPFKINYDEAVENPESILEIEKSEIESKKTNSDFYQIQNKVNSLKIVTLLLRWQQNSLEAMLEQKTHNQGLQIMMDGCLQRFLQVDTESKEGCDFPAWMQQDRSLLTFEQRREARFGFKSFYESFSCEHIKQNKQLLLKRELKSKRS